MKCMCGCDTDMQECEHHDSYKMDHPFGLRSDVSFLFCPICDCVAIVGKPYKGE